MAARLLVAAVAGVVNMGISMIPSMASKTVSLAVMLPEDTEKDVAFAVADQVMERARCWHRRCSGGVRDGGVRGMCRKLR